MQQTLPPEGQRTYPNVCAWCGASPAEPYELERAQRRAGDAEREVGE
jgi:hypothetical protein